MTKKNCDRIYFWSFLIPCLTYIFAWRILPLCYTFFLSFLKYDIIKGNQGFVGISNYIDVLTGDRFHHSIRLTVLFTLVATLLQFLIGLLLAVLLTTNLKGENTFKVLLLFPMFIANVAVGTVWYIMYHNQVGPLNYFLESLNIGSISWLSSPTSALFALAISDTWQWTPFIFVLLFAGLQSIDPQLYEAAGIDGASSFQSFWYISLPLLKKTILMTLILRSMDAFRTFGKVYVLTGGGPGRSTEVITMLIYRTAFKWFKMDQAAALVIILLALLGGTYYFVVTRLLGGED